MQRGTASLTHLGQDRARPLFGDLPSTPATQQNHQRDEHGQRTTGEGAAKGDPALCASEVGLAER